MSRKLHGLPLAALLLGGAAHAEVPRVAADIAPVHSLVARVMNGIGSPALIVQPGASPHEYALRPSEAAALQAADLVFWVGPDLTPWMTHAIETLADDATVTALLDAEGTQRLDFREGVGFEAHEHGADEHEDHEAEHHEEDHGDAHGHDHADHAEAEKEAHDDAHDDLGHDDNHAHGDGHDHGAQDPHAWLSPRNAATWLDVIAARLAAADPDNAAAYAANAAAARTELETLSAEVAAMLDPLRGGRFVVFHDAYQYLENRFGLTAIGSITVNPEAGPSAERLTEVKHRLGHMNAACVFAEPQFPPQLVAVVTEGNSAGTAVLDPLGATLQPGEDLYFNLMREMAASLSECLSRAS